MGPNTHPRYGRAGGIARHLFLVLAMIAAQLALATIAAAQQPATREGAQVPAPNKMHRIAIVLARERRDVPPPLSLLDMPPPDDGVAGARLAINDNNTTGRFLKQEFTLEVVQNGDIRELVAQVKRHVEGGVSFIVADLRPQTMVALADALKGQRALILNAGSSDDRLREQDCRPNVVHTAPSRAMLADALAQYLVWKHWRRWFLVHGTEPDDEAFAEALRRAAKRFGAKIVEERPFKYEVGSRRADGGHEQIQQQIPTFTQNAPAYDVLVVADEGGLFGEYLPYRTLGCAAGGGNAGAGADELASGARAVGRDPIPEPLSTACQSAHATARLRCLGRGPLDRRGGDAREVGGARGHDRASEIGRFRPRRLQGTQAHLSRLGWAAAPADPDRDRQAAGDGLAATGLPAPILRARHARHRQAGDHMSRLRALSLFLD